MDSERIDFSALDPARDERRWQRTVDSLVTRALAERRARLSIARQSLLWARPVLAVAAVLSLIAWTAGFFARDSTHSFQSPQYPAALTLANWAANNEIPATSDLFSTLGDSYGNQ